MEEQFDYQVAEQRVKNIQELRDEVRAESLKILHLNIRSIGKHYHELIVLLQKFATLPDIIVATETWSTNGLALYSIEDYDIFLYI